jgi:hypothetical protein
MVVTLAARPRTALLFASVLSALVVAVVAVLDHRHTRALLEPTFESAWYCANRGTRCDEPQPGPIHERWEIREYTYKAAFGLSALTFAGAMVGVVRSRSR